MSDNPIPVTLSPTKTTLSDRIRGIANELRQENDVQIKVTSRILGAAAQIAQNHDRLINEVVEMVEEDLGQQSQSEFSELYIPESYTVEQLQQQFKTLKDAKAHFGGIKAASWVALASKLNAQSKSRHVSTSNSPNSLDPPNSLDQRLETLAHEVQTMRETINEVLQLLNLIARKIL
jgi:hypothetical protein